MSEAGGARMPTSPLDKPVPEMNRAELRGKIALKAGKRTNWSTPLDKGTLNAVYAYITGGYHTPKRALHRHDHSEFSPKEEILVAVVHECGIGELDDDWSHTTEYTPDHLRRDELQSVYEKMQERGDQFHTSDGEDDGQ